MAKHRITVRDITGVTTSTAWDEFSAEELESMRNLARNFTDLNSWALSTELTHTSWWESFNPKYIVSVKIETSNG